MRAFHKSDGVMTRIALSIALVALMSNPANAAEYEGRLQWHKRVDLGFQVSGVLSEVPVQVGQEVKKGTLLAKLDQRRFAARAKYAEANVKAQQLNRDEANRELDRANALYERTQLSDHDKQMAQLQSAKAAAALLAAEAAKTNADINLEYSALKAPFDAKVIRVHRAPGQSIVSALSSEPVVVVVDAQRMAVRLLLTTSQLANLKPGGNAKVEVRDEWRAAVIEQIGLLPEGKKDKDPLYELLVTFPVKQDEVLRSGSFVSVEL